MDVVCMSVVVCSFLLSAPVCKSFATLTLRCPHMIFFCILHGCILMLDCCLVALGLKLGKLVVEFGHFGRGEGLHCDLVEVLGLVAVGAAVGSSLLSPLLPSCGELLTENVMEGLGDVDGETGLVVLCCLHAQYPFFVMSNGTYFPSWFVPLLLANDLGVHCYCAS